MALRDDLEAVIAVLDLLPPEEREEFVGRVRSYQDNRTVKMLEQLQVTANQAPVDKRVAKYVRLRDQLAAINKAADTMASVYKDTLKVIEQSLLADADSQGVTGFKTEFGTTFSEVTERASIADDEAFYSYVRATGDLEFFERRIKSTHVAEYQKVNAGALPPGINVYRERVMKVRRK